MKRLLVFLVIIAAIGYGGSRAYDSLSYQVYTPVSSQSQPVTVTVSQGESAKEVSTDLAARGLIRSAVVFEYYLRFSGAGPRIEAGQHKLDKNMNMPRMADALSVTVADQVTVTIPEGYTVAKTAEAVEQAGFGKAADYVAAAKDSAAWKNDFLAGRPPNADLEGYLYPETYSLNKGATVRDLIQRQLDQFGKVYSADLRSRTAQAVPGRPAQTVSSIVILASIVEREANRDGDRPKVCEVYYNRLAQGMPLQADATVLYALGVWKKQVLLEDLKVQSPYNTYLHPGLPPGPIANPGAASIKACIDPDKNNYVYYFTDKQGVTRFATTLDEFERLKAQYGVSGS